MARRIPNRETPIAQSLDINEIWYRYLLDLDAAVTNGGGGDLDYEPEPTQGTVTNTGGTDAVIPSFDDTNAGLAPGSGGGTSNFLRADGTWAVPPGGGATLTGIPVVTSPTTPDRTLLGKCLSITSGITIDDGVFEQSDIWYIFNNTGSALTITQGSGMTLRLVGTPVTGDVLLPAFGMISVYFPIDDATALIDGSYS